MIRPISFGTLLLLTVLAWWSQPAWSQDEAAPAAAPPALVFELSAARPSKTLTGPIPEGWDEARLARADALFYGAERITLRRLIEIVIATEAPQEVVILAEPEARFARLRAIMLGFKNSETKNRPLFLATTRKPRQRQQLQFFSNGFTRMIFSNGSFEVQESEGDEEDLSADFDPADAELPEAERLLKARERQQRRQLELSLSPNDWQLEKGAKETKVESFEERLKTLRTEIRALKAQEGRVYLRLRVDNELLLGQLQEVMALAAEESVDSLKIGDDENGYSQFLRAFGFGRLGDPIWLPRVVENGLKSLARSQKGNGNWAAAENSELDDLGTTALAMLAFLGEFHSPEEGSFQKEVGKAHSYIVGRQRENGALAGATEGFSFAHVLATFALVETYGLTGDEDHGSAAGKALGFMLRCRNEAGLWGLQANDAAPDLLVTCWALVALSAAEDAGLDLPEAIVEPVVAWLDTLMPKDSGRPRSAGAKLTRLRGVVDEFYGRHAESLTAVAALMRSRGGAEPMADERLLAALQAITSSPPDQGGRLGPVDLDYLYFGALLMNVHGGSHWHDWHLGLEDAVQGHFQNLQGQATGIRGLLDADPAIVAILTSCLELSYRYSRNPASRR